MNKELFMVVIPAVSWVLFALGGTAISDKIKGKKWIRRYLLPAFYLGFCLLAGIVWWKTLLVASLAAGFFTLGYGDSTPWGEKYLVGASYGLVSSPIGVSWWNIFTALGFISLFALSNFDLTKKIFIWKICEGTFGLLVGIQLSFVLL